MNAIANLGRIALNAIERLGRAALFLVEVLAGSREVARRFILVVQQVYAVGVLTLLIILVSGLFVGMVLGLQGYNTLVKFGAEDSLGLLVALSLVRELGPVVTALLFAGRAGSALTAEIGLMKATEQIAGMEMMAVNPVTRVIAPRFLAGVIAMPLLAALFSRGRRARRAHGRRRPAGRGRRLVLVADAERRRFPRGYPERRHQEPGVRRRRHLDRGVRGLRRRADLRGRGARHQSYRGVFVARGAGARLHSDFADLGEV